MPALTQLAQTLVLMEVTLLGNPIRHDCFALAVQSHRP